MTEKHERSFNLYQFQKNAFPVLTGWSVGSIIAGILWVRMNSPWNTGFGSQFIGWGLVDLVLAILGLRSAHHNLNRLNRGEIDEQELNRQQSKFEGLLWINAGLDVGYVTGGALLAKKSNDNSFRRGTAWGILIQGSFLLVWDLILAVLMRRASKRVKMQ